MDGLVQAYKQGWRQYATFDGRTSRASFWRFFAVNTVLIFGLYGLVIWGRGGLSAGTTPESVPVLVMFSVFVMSSIIPMAAISARRLHDTGRSGWWWLLTLVPVLWIVVVVFWALDSESGSNAYGPPPGSAEHGLTGSQPIGDSPSLHMP